MSEEQRITNAVKEKDPRRVEAGKRLGAISRAAKENKARLRMESEPAEDTREEGYCMITVITGVGVLSGLVCLYFTYRQDKRATATEPPAETQSNDNSTPQKSPAGQKPVGRKLISFDD
jgi:hypothetical protein